MNLQIILNPLIKRNISKNKKEIIGYMEVHNFNEIKAVVNGTEIITYIDGMRADIVGLFDSIHDNKEFVKLQKMGLQIYGEISIKREPFKVTSNLKTELK